ncbi:MAG: SagB/ThcOx family dehydrogenase [Dehalogenimonas sp.]
MTELISLPEPKKNGDVSVEAAIFRRRSIRQFNDMPLTLDQLSQLLWAAQGTLIEEHRTVPSAGGTFPLDVLAVVGDDGVQTLETGVFLYVPAENGLMPRQTGDFRLSLMKHSYGQKSIVEAPISLIITADYERTRLRYRQRAERYVHMEAGHAAQNVYLQATALGLGALAIGAFEDQAVMEILGFGGNHTPLYIMPVGVAPITLPAVF